MRETLDRRGFLSGAASILVCACADAAPIDRTQSPRTYGFEKALWFDGTDFRSGSFYSSNGILTFNRPTSLDEMVDLSGRYVVPPFAEAHNHDSPQI